jgi:hypothetical protein
MGMEELHNELDSLCISPDTVLLGDEVKNGINGVWEKQDITNFHCKPHWK